ncbi:MAG TPA: hypothetical protein PKL97_02505 [Candidatus Omnitrophota bacterium]|nr:hypothetical protein [Candidatus Omnitrophota bacterium]
MKRKAFWIFAGLAPVLFFSHSILRAQANPPRLAPPDWVDQNLEKIRTVKAYVEIRIADFNAKSSRQAFAQIAAQKTHYRFYLKAFGPSTPEHFTLAADRGLFWLKIPRLKTVFAGPEEALLPEELEWQLSPQDFREMLFPDPIRQENKKIEIADSPLHWIVSSFIPAGRDFLKDREIRIDRRSLRIVKDVRYSVGGTPYLEIAWDEPRENARGETFSTQITLTKQTLGREIRLGIRKWEINAEIPEDLFSKPSPEGFKTEELRR